MKKQSEFDERALDELSALVAGEDADGVSVTATTDDDDNQDDPQDKIPSSCNKRPAQSDLVSWMNFLCNRVRCGAGWQRLFYQ